MVNVISTLKQLVKTPVKRAWNAARAVPYYGQGRWCPVCERASRRFRSYGIVPRPEAECVHCGALERHRIVWLYFQRHTDLFDGRPKRMLHVAPESCFEAELRKRLGAGYLTADLFNPRAMVKLDVTAIPFPDESFDVIYCSHVLEHVQDDRQAMREFYRTLKRDGWAVLLVPITAAATYEDPSVVDPRERLRLFGQEDHVRRYGPDYVDRLREAGFQVQIIPIADLLEKEDRVKLGLVHGNREVFCCTKPR